MTAMLDSSIIGYLRRTHHSHSERLTAEPIPQALDRAIAWARREVAKLSEQARALAHDATMHATRAEDVLGRKETP